MDVDLSKLEIDEDIARASTLPGSFYRDPQAFERVKERVFARSWHWLGDTDGIKAPGSVQPQLLLEGALEEPVVVTRDLDDNLHCLSNVCTHRGTLVCEGAGVEQMLRCRYHGRRFGLDGRFHSMPEFEEVEGFPSAADDLPELPLARWKKFLFASLDPAMPFEAVIAEMDKRVGWLPIDEGAV